MRVLFIAIFTCLYFISPSAKSNEAQDLREKAGITLGMTF